MLARLRNALTYANVVSSLCLFIVLGGVAWAALPVNSVTQKQIRKGAVGKSEIAANAVGASEVKTDSIGGRDVRESNLGQVPRAADADTLGGVPITGIPFGRSDNNGGCDPNVALGTVPVCASTEYVLPRTGKVLIVAALQWHTSGDTAPSSGTCQMRVDGVPVGDSMLIGELGPTEDTDSTHPRGVSGTAITDSLTAASHRFELVCSEEDSNVDINRASMSTVLLGPD